MFFIEQHCFVNAGKLQVHFKGDLEERDLKKNNND